MNTDLSAHDLLCLIKEEQAAAAREAEKMVKDLDPEAVMRMGRHHNAVRLYMDELGRKLAECAVRIHKRGAA
jgi:hypothetical protein